jgi:hypothetical protein
MKTLYFVQAVQAVQAFIEISKLIYELPIERADSHDVHALPCARGDFAKKHGLLGLLGQKLITCCFITIYCYIINSTAWTVLGQKALLLPPTYH